MYLKSCALFALVSIVSACGSSSSSGNQTSAPTPPVVLGPTPTSSGLVAAGDTTRMDLDFKSYGEVTGAAGAVSYATGFDPFTGSGIAVGVSAIEDVRVGATGVDQATFNGEYQFSYIDTVVVDAAGYSGYQGDFQGGVTLFVNFNTGEFEGGGIDAGSTSAILVDGTVSGQSLSGTVDVAYSDGSFSNSMTTTLSGVAGADGTVGAFHGNNADTVISGGFVAQ